MWIIDNVLKIMAPSIAQNFIRAAEKSGSDKDYLALRTEDKSGFYKMLEKLQEIGIKKLGRRKNPYRNFSGN